MSTDQNPGTANSSETMIPATQSHILTLLEGLPPESLTVVEQFILFLRQQAQQGRPVINASDAASPPYRYPTVPLPASALDGWLNLIPEGYEGDALADTEALYDEV